MKRTLGRALIMFTFTAAAFAFLPTSSKAQFLDGGFSPYGFGGGFGGPGFGFGGGFGGPGFGFGGNPGFGGIGFGGLGYGGFGGIYGGVGNAFYNPFYINYGLNPNTLATGITPIAIQSAIANQNLIGAGRAAAPPRPIVLTPGTYRLVIERQ